MGIPQREAHAIMKDSIVKASFAPMRDTGCLTRSVSCYAPWEEWKRLDINPTRDKEATNRLWWWGRKVFQTHEGIKSSLSVKKHCKNFFFFNFEFRASPKSFVRSVNEARVSQDTSYKFIQLVGKYKLPITCILQRMNWTLRVET